MLLVTLFMLWKISTKHFLEDTAVNVFSPTANSLEAEDAVNDTLHAVEKEEELCKHFLEDTAVNNAFGPTADSLETLWRRTLLVTLLMLWKISTKHFLENTAETAVMPQDDGHGDSDSEGIGFGGPELGLKLLILKHMFLNGKAANYLKLP